MEYKYSHIMDSSKYDTQGLYDGIDLRRHLASDLEGIGAFRIQEDWRCLVGPLDMSLGTAWARTLVSPLGRCLRVYWKD